MRLLTSKHTKCNEYKFGDMVVSVYSCVCVSSAGYQVSRSVQEMGTATVVPANASYKRNYFKRYNTCM